MDLITLVKQIQKEIGVTPDGIWGPLSEAALKAALQPKQAAPWMDWMKARDGWGENNHEKELAKYWPLCGLNYSTIIGASHAWCALTINAALHSTGYKGNGRADAVSFETYGTPCGFSYGAIIPIRHSNGHHHVSFFDHWIDEKNWIASLRGGNQGNKLHAATYNLSGNMNGHDECVSGPRWPVKA